MTIPPLHSCSELRVFGCHLSAADSGRRGMKFVTRVARVFSGGYLDVWNGC